MRQGERRAGPVFWGLNAGLPAGAPKRQGRGGIAWRCRNSGLDRDAEKGGKRFLRLGGTKGKRTFYQNQWAWRILPLPEGKDVKKAMLWGAGD